MRIYIDFDDVICETARRFSEIAKEMFGIDVPYSRMCFFNLQKSFGLTDTQYEKLMQAGHLPENLLGYQETPGASGIINQWMDAGQEVFVITGRPFDSYELSRKWLDVHGLGRVPLYCVDKYSRWSSQEKHPNNLTLEELYRMDFDLAVEDSPTAFEHIMHFENCRVAVFDRPWNRDADLPNERFERCMDWNDVKKLSETCRTRKNT